MANAASISSYSFDQTPCSASIFESKSWEGRAVCVLDIGKQLGCATFDIGFAVLATAYKTLIITTQLIIPLIITAIGAVILTTSLSTPCVLLDLIASIAYGSIFGAIGIGLLYYTFPENIGHPLDVIAHLGFALPSNLLYRTTLVAADVLGIIDPRIGQSARNSSVINKLYIPIHKGDFDRGIRSSGIFLGTHLSFLETSIFSRLREWDPITNTFKSTPRSSTSSSSNSYSTYSYQTPSSSSYNNYSTNTSSSRPQASSTFSSSSSSSYRPQANTYSSWNTPSSNPYNFGASYKQPNQDLEEFLSRLDGLSSASSSSAPLLAPRPWSIERIENLKYSEYENLSQSEITRLKLFLSTHSQRIQINEMITRADLLCERSFLYRYMTLKECNEEFIKQADARNNASSSTSSYVSLQERNDAYDALEVSRGTSWEETKTAYRKLARQWHPDKNPESTVEGSAAYNKWHAIQTAYTTLENHFMNQK